MKSRKLKIHFCNMQNFGDQLNFYIFKKCFNIDIEHASSWDCQAFGIGSILEKLLWQTKDIKPEALNYFKQDKKNVIILSSGLGFEDEYYYKKPRFYKTMKFKRTPIPISLRGEYTKKSLEKILNKKLEETIIGDLGLLSSYLIDNCKIEKKYNLGICPHYADQKNPIFQKILKNNPNSTILNTRENAITFLHKMCECKTILSTGLHPLIAADSIGIPNLWGRVSESTTPRFKYNDYYSVYKIKPEPYNLLDNKFQTQYIYENYKINFETVQTIKNNIYNSLNEYFDKMYS